MFQDPSDLPFPQQMIFVLAWVGYLALLWALIPPLMTFLGLTHIWYEVSENPELATEGSDSLEVMARVEDVLKLGYRPLGRVIEHARFFNDHWHWSSTPGARRFISPDGLVHAHVSKRNPKSFCRVYFSTVFADGCRLLSAIPGAGVTVLKREHIRTELGHLSVSKAEASHRQSLAIVARESGHQPVKMSLSAEADNDLDRERRLFRSMGHFKLHAFSHVAMWLCGPAEILLLAVYFRPDLIPLLRSPREVAFGVGLVFGLFVYLWVIHQLYPSMKATVERDLAAQATAEFNQAGFEANLVRFYQESNRRRW